MKTLLVSAIPASFFLSVGIGSIFPAKYASAQAPLPALVLRAGEALETETARLRERGLTSRHQQYRGLSRGNGNRAVRGREH